MNKNTTSSPTSFKSSDEFIDWAIQAKAAVPGRSGSNQIDAQVALQHKTGVISDEQLKRYQQG